MIHVMNTHYDDGGSLSRSESSYIIRQESYAYFKRIEAELGEQTSTIPIAVILMGDFSTYSAFQRARITNELIS